VLIPAVCYLGAVRAADPGILSHNLSSAIWLDIGGAALLSAANPPLNAARLDIMPSQLWAAPSRSGRSSVRSFRRSPRSSSPGSAPPSSDHANAGRRFAPPPSKANLYHVATGLEWSFLILLATLAAAGIFLARARHTYPVDVATAAASQA